MLSPESVIRTRAALGQVGVFLPWSPGVPPSAEHHRVAAQRLEEAGYRTAWTNEIVGGKDALVQLTTMLSATRRMAFGTSIMNMWARAPQVAHAAAAYLSEAYPDRVAFGLGVGYPVQATSVGREFGSPVRMLREYVEKMPEDSLLPPPAAQYPLLIGATGPKLTELSGQIADGPLLIQVPCEYTREVRDLIGPDKLVVVGLPVVCDPDRDQAGRKARERLRMAMEHRRVLRPGQRDTQSELLVRLGYTPEDVEELSDRLVDALIGHGDGPGVASCVRRHLDAGADHVMVMATEGDVESGLDALIDLAPELTSHDGAPSVPRADHP